MSMIEMNWKPDQRTLKQFGWISLVAFGALGALAWWKHKFLFFHLSDSAAHTTAYVLWAIAGLSAVLGVVAPMVLQPLFVGLMLIALPIGFVLSHVILFIVFFVFFTPLGLVMRLFGYDPMRKRFDRQAKTYWLEREVVTDPKRYFRQF